MLNSPEGIYAKPRFRLGATVGWGARARAQGGSCPPPFPACHPSGAAHGWRPISCWRHVVCVCVCVCVCARAIEMIATTCHVLGYVMRYLAAVASCVARLPHSASFMHTSRDLQQLRDNWQYNNIINPCVDAANSPSSGRECVAYAQNSIILWSKDTCKYASLVLFIKLPPKPSWILSIVLPTNEFPAIIENHLRGKVLRHLHIIPQLFTITSFKLILRVIHQLQLQLQYCFF